jgi:hypothetical protein
LKKYGYNQQTKKWNQVVKRRQSPLNPMSDFVLSALKEASADDSSDEPNPETRFASAAIAIGTGKRSTSLDQISVDDGDEDQQAIPRIWSHNDIYGISSPNVQEYFQMFESQDKIYSGLVGTTRQFKDSGSFDVAEVGPYSVFDSNVMYDGGAAYTTSHGPSILPIGSPENVERVISSNEDEDGGEGEDLNPEQQLVASSIDLSFLGTTNHSTENIPASGSSMWPLEQPESVQLLDFGFEDDSTSNVLPIADESSSGNPGMWPFEQPEGELEHASQLVYQYDFVSPTTEATDFFNEHHEPFRNVPSPTTLPENAGPETALEHFEFPPGLLRSNTEDVVEGEGEGEDVVVQDDDESDSVQDEGEDDLVQDEGEGEIVQDEDDDDEYDGEDYEDYEEDEHDGNASTSFRSVGSSGMPIPPETTNVPIPDNEDLSDDGSNSDEDEPHHETPNPPSSSNVIIHTQQHSLGSLSPSNEVEPEGQESSESEDSFNDSDSQSGQEQVDEGADSLHDSDAPLEDEQTGDSGIFDSDHQQQEPEQDQDTLQHESSQLDDLVGDDEENVSVSSDSSGRDHEEHVVTASAVSLESDHDDSSEHLQDLSHDSSTEIPSLGASLMPHQEPTSEVFQDSHDITTYSSNVPASIVTVSEESEQQQFGSPHLESSSVLYHGSAMFSSANGPIYMTTERSPDGFAMRRNSDSFEDIPLDKSFKSNRKLFKIRESSESSDDSESSNSSSDSSSSETVDYSRRKTDRTAEPIVFSRPIPRGSKTRSKKLSEPSNIGNDLVAESEIIQPPATLNSTAAPLLESESNLLSNNSSVILIVVIGVSAFIALASIIIKKFVMKSTVNTVI